MVKVALDTGCLNARGKHPELNKLDELEKEGKITLSTSSTSRREQIETQKDPVWLDKYEKRIDELQEDNEPAMVGVSRVGMSQVASNSVPQLVEDLKKICFPGKKLSKNDINDIEHLASAIENSADVFVTMNKKDMIDNGKREEIEKYGIKVRQPNQALIDELSK